MWNKIVEWPTHHKVIASILAIIIGIGAWTLYFAMRNVTSPTSSTTTAQSAPRKDTTKDDTSSSEDSSLSYQDKLHQEAHDVVRQQQELLALHPTDLFTDDMSALTSADVARQVADMDGADMNLNTNVQNALNARGSGADLDKEDYDRLSGSLSDAWKNYQKTAWQAAYQTLTAWVESKTGGDVFFNRAVTTLPNYPKSCLDMSATYNEPAVSAFQVESKTDFDTLVNRYKKYEQLRDQCVADMTPDQQVATQDRY